MSETKLNIYHRLQMAIDKAGVAEKTGKAAREMGGFAYHKIDDVVDHLRAILIDVGIALIPSVESCDVHQFQTGKGNFGYHAKVVMKVKLVNVDVPDEFIEMGTVGDGIDYGDKSTGKAYSYALKSALLAAFQLRGQPDNEETDHEQQSAPAQQGRVTQPPPQQQTRPASTSPSVPSMEERKKAPWAIPDLSPFEQKIPNWREVIHHKRKDKGATAPSPKPLGDCSKAEIKWWADNWALPMNPAKEDTKLRVALNMARRELAIEEAGEPASDDKKEWPAPGDDPFV